MVFPIVNWSTFDVKYLTLTLDVRGHNPEHGIRSCIEGLNVLPSSRLEKLRLIISRATASSVNEMRNALVLFKNVDDVFTRRQFRLLEEVSICVFIDYTGDCHHPMRSFTLTFHHCSRSTGGSII